MGVDMCVQGRMYVEHMSAPVQVNVYACGVDMNTGCRCIGGSMHMESCTLVQVYMSGYMQVCTSEGIHGCACTWCECTWVCLHTWVWIYI